MIVFTGFVLGLNNLYWYYPYEVRKYVEVTPHSNPEDIKPMYRTKGVLKFGT